MVAAVTIFIATVALQIAAVAALASGLRSGAQASQHDGRAGSGHQPWRVDVVTVAVGVAPLLHAAALFSDSFLLAEGQMLGYGLATLAVILTRSACMALATDHEAESERGDPACNAAPLTDGHGSAAEQRVKVPAPGSDKGTKRKGVQRGSLQNALCIGAVLLLAGWALGARGLVKRSSHDAMWRAVVPPKTVEQETGSDQQRHAATHPAAVAAGANFLLASPELRSFLAAAASAALAAGACAAVYGPLLVLPSVLLQARARLLHNTRCVGSL